MPRWNRSLIVEEDTNTHAMCIPALRREGSFCSCIQHAFQPRTLVSAHLSFDSPSFHTGIVFGFAPLASTIISALASMLAISMTYVVRARW